MSAKLPIRRSQLISPFGVGAMIDFPGDESLMLAGLDVWPRAKEECPEGSGMLIREERLEKRLGVKEFRMPPDYRESEFGEGFKKESLPFLRFPTWHYCHLCGGMKQLSHYSPGRAYCDGHNFDEYSCAKRKWKPKLIPVRIVAVCDAGHIQDFPFMEWVHRKTPPTPKCRLRTRGGWSTAGLSGTKIVCTCGQAESLGNVFNFASTPHGPLHSIGCTCKGSRPWLGEIGVLSCPSPLRVLQRGSTNLYFPNVVSSIYLPLWAEKADEEIISILEKPECWRFFQSSTKNGRLDINPEILKLVADFYKVDPQKLEIGLRAKTEGDRATTLEDQLADDEAFRHSEYKAICEGRGGPLTELYSVEVPIDKYKGKFPKYFSKVRLIHKLRETSVLNGFTRVFPAENNYGDPRIQSLKIDPQIDWLPAVKVYGEGIFLELNLEEVNRWSMKHKILKDRMKPLSDRYNEARERRKQTKRPLSLKFLLLHTLAHTLIKQLSFDSGYGAASIRERLYCDFTGSDGPMQGILLYTASGDSEGTLGGLVRKGKIGYLEPMIQRALKGAEWCASDPVCIESNGQGFDNTNLAACHCCCLLPETSCEEGNRLLDRALLIGVPEKPELGFFHHLVS